MINTIVKTKLRSNPELRTLYDEMGTTLGEMEVFLRTLTQTPVRTLEENVSRMVCSGGKRLRPMLAYLSYRCGGGGERDIVPLMTMLELMHTASLVHDDVVDCADQRRGAVTIHKTIGNHGAVQCGDFLLARAMELLKQYKGTGVNEILSETSVEMCLGELMQMGNAFSLEDQTQERYFLQVKRKTAYLLSASAQTGALAGGMTGEESTPLRDYGLELGMAFQLKDDLLDFAPAKVLGKPRGQDLRRGIITLPVRYALEHSPDEEMCQLLQCQSKRDTDVERLIRYIDNAGGLAYTQQVLEESSQRAVLALAPLADGPEKLALQELASTLADRKL